MSYVSLSLNLFRIRKVVVVVLLVVLLIVYGLISFLIAQGVTSADRNVQEDHPSNYGLVFEDVEFGSRDGEVSLSGWYLPGDVLVPHLIFVHGNGSVRSGDNAVDIASRLVGRGYNILLFDMRGRGSSEGDTASGGYFERRDVLGAFDYLVNERGASPLRVGLVGFSLGAATAIMAAAVEPGFAAVVADSPFADAADMVTEEAARKSLVPRWLVPIFVPTSKLMADLIYRINIGELVPERDVEKLDYPVLVIHGEADGRVPIEQAERVAAAGQPGTFLWRVPRVDHVDAFKTHPEEYTDRVTAYLDELLR